MKSIRQDSVPWSTLTISQVLTLSEKDVPVVTTREDNVLKYKLLSKITLNLHKMLFSLSNNKIIHWELACE